MSSCHLPGKDPGPTVSTSWKPPWPWHFTQVRKFEAREAADWPQITQGESARSGARSAPPAPGEKEGCHRPCSTVTSKVAPLTPCSPRALGERSCRPPRIRTHGGPEFVQTWGSRDDSRLSCFPLRPSPSQLPGFCCAALTAAMCPRGPGSTQYSGHSKAT